jgi:hypothetical protein
MRKIWGYILYAGLLILLLYGGSQLFQYLRVLAGRTFRYGALLSFISVFSILLGMYLALPEFMAKVKTEGKWSVNWSRVIIVGGISLLLTAAPILGSITPIGQYAPQLLMWLVTYSHGPALAGMVCGYTILASLQKDQTVNGNR